MLEDSTVLKISNNLRLNWWKNIQPLQIWIISFCLEFES